MPHSALKLVPGADTQETPALNESGAISQTNLIRFVYDRNGIALVQKLGGWKSFYPLPMTSITRALWAWEDLNVTAHLAVGNQTNTGTGAGQLGVITSNGLSDYTPTYAADNIAPVVSTTSGSASVTITDSTITSITAYNTVYIATQISIGGIVLFGLYACDPDGYLGASSYTVYSITQLGALNPATSTSTTPALPKFTTTAGSLTAVVNLPNHGYVAQSTFPVLTPTGCGGITVYGSYVVQQVLDANDFTILLQNPAVYGDTEFMNGGNARFVYSFGSGFVTQGNTYGIGGYGQGGYGTGTTVVPSVGTPIDASDWTFDNWGQILLACPIRTVPNSGTLNGTQFQPIYQWSVGAASATIITNAPPVNDGIFVAMPQRQIVAWGSTQTGIQDPLLISWCDVGNFNQWIPLVTNQAGSYRIPKGSRIVGMVQGPQQAIAWTDIDCWSMQYIGPPYVYSFNEIGTGCGLIARKAAAFTENVGYWMGPSGFFTLSANGAQPLPCPIWDIIFQNLDQNNLSKIRVAVNSRFNEIQWFYPSVSGGSGENDSYIKYNTLIGVWDYGSLGRSAWIDQSVLGPPIGADPVSLNIYQHETSNDAGTSAMVSSFRTGYFAIAEGDLKTFIDLIWPDMKWGMNDAAQTATVQITFYVLDYPGDTPQVFGPYSVTKATEYFNTRLRGRLVSVQIGSSDLGSFWRTGNLRYRAAPDGKF